MVNRKVQGGFFAAIAVVMIAGTAHAKETHSGDGFPSLGVSVRALGMGNAMLTVPGRETFDMLYNPTALHDLPHGVRFDLPGIRVVASKSIYSVIKDVKDLQNQLKASLTDSGDITAFQTFFNNHVGQFQTARVAVPLLGFSWKDWGFGVLTDSRSTVSMRNRAFPNFELRSRSDAAVVAGKSLGFFGSDLVVGAVVKGIYRAEIDRVLTEGDIVGTDLASTLGWSQWAKAFGVGADLGARYTMSMVPLHPTIAMTYQDVGKTRFFGKSSINTPQTVNAAVGIHGDLAQFNWALEVGASQLNHKKDFMSRTHVGAELRFPSIGGTTIALRGGANQGYGTGGVSIYWPGGALDVAYYGEEIGEVRRQGASYNGALGLHLYF